MARKRKTTATIDRLIVCKIESNRRILTYAIKVEIESELTISLHVNTIRNRTQEAELFDRVA